MYMYTYEVLKIGVEIADRSSTESLLIDNLLQYGKMGWFQYRIA